MDDQPQLQAQHVDQRVPLAAVDLLAGVEAVLVTDLGRLYTLAVDDRDGRLGLAASLFARRHKQGSLDRRPGVLLPKSPEVTVDRTRRRNSLGSIRHGQPVRSR